MSEKSQKYFFPLQKKKTVVVSWYNDQIVIQGCCFFGQVPLSFCSIYWNTLEYNVKKYHIYIMVYFKVPHLIPSLYHGTAKVLLFFIPWYSDSTRSRRFGFIGHRVNTTVNIRVRCICECQTNSVSPLMFNFEREQKQNWQASILFRRLFMAFEQLP